MGQGAGQEKAWEKLDRRIVSVPECPLFHKDTWSPGLGGRNDCRQGGLHGWPGEALEDGQRGQVKVMRCGGLLSCSPQVREDAAGG